MKLTQVRKEEIEVSDIDNIQDGNHYDFLLN